MVPLLTCSVSLMLGASTLSPELVNWSIAERATRTMRVALPAVRRPCRSETSFEPTPGSRSSAKRIGSVPVSSSRLRWFSISRTSEARSPVASPVSGPECDPFIWWLRPSLSQAEPPVGDRACLGLGGNIGILRTRWLPYSRSRCEGSLFHVGSVLTVKRRRVDWGAGTATCARVPGERPTRVVEQARTSSQVAVADQSRCTSPFAAAPEEASLRARCSFGEG